MYHLTDKEHAQAVRLVERMHKVLNNKPGSAVTAALINVTAEVCLLGAQGSIDMAQVRADSIMNDVKQHIVKVAADIIKRMAQETRQ